MHGFLGGMMMVMIVILGCHVGSDQYRSDEVM